MNASCNNKTMISGKTDKSFLTQTSTIVRSLDQVSQEKIIDNLDVKVSIFRTEHSAALKANLSISWNLMHNIRSWLHTFKIKLAPEGKTLKLTKEWVDGLRSEHAPLFINKGKVQPHAWCYLYNLVGHILKQQCFNVIDAIDANVSVTRILLFRSRYKNGCNFCKRWW